MSSATSSDTSSVKDDDCSICLSALAIGTPLLTLSCGHKFHLQCLASNVKAQNNECPLCRASLETSLRQLLSSTNSRAQQPKIRLNLIAPNILTNVVIPSVEDPVDEAAVRAFSSRINSAGQASASSTSESLPLITASTTLEFDGQISHQESNIYGLVTLKAPSGNQSSTEETLSRVPIDLVCVVDQSGSMDGEKMILLKETLVYITEQLNEFDRLAIVSFDTNAFDQSHGLKRMNKQNQQILKTTINNDIRPRGGTYIGCGLEKGIELFTTRQTKNPISALLLLTDGQDNNQHDYSQLMQTIPEDVVCHTFGYGPDHTVSLLADLAEKGNEGTFTYIDEQDAVGPAFATALASLLTCVAQNIHINIEFDGEYTVTHTHSKYKHEPDQLPSSKITFILKDLNAGEQRNLMFQLHVPKTDTEPSVEMLSQDPMSQGLSEEEVKLVNDKQVIGRVSINYIEPGNGQTLNSTPVPFRLTRAFQLSPDLLRVNHTIDLQRNRVETAAALKQAMDETGYTASTAILKAQVDKIQASVSAQEPFCQQLIEDLQHRYRTEREYRSSHTNTYQQQATERSTYTPSYNLSAQMYQTLPQQAYVNQYQSQRPKKS